MKDLLSLPQEAFYAGPPRSLILAMCTLKDFKDLYYDVEAEFCTANCKLAGIPVYHCSEISCYENWDVNHEVVTVCRETGAWTWRVHQKEYAR